MDSDRQHSRIIGWHKGAAHMRTALSIGDILWCYWATNGSFNDSMFLPGSFMKGSSGLRRHRLGRRYRAAGERQAATANRRQSRLPNEEPNPAVLEWEDSIPADSTWARDADT